MSRIQLVDHLLGAPVSPDRRRGQPAPGGMVELRLTFEVDDGHAVVNGVLTEAAQLAHEVGLAVAAKRDDVYGESRRLENQVTKVRQFLTDADQVTKHATEALQNALRSGADPAEAEDDLANVKAHKANLERRLTMLTEEAGVALTAAHRQFAAVERQVRSDAVAKLQTQIDAASAKLSELIERCYPDLAVLTQAKRLIRDGH